MLKEGEFKMKKIVKLILTITLAIIPSLPIYSVEEKVKVNATPIIYNLRKVTPRSFVYSDVVIYAECPHNWSGKGAIEYIGTLTLPRKVSYTKKMLNTDGNDTGLIVIDFIYVDVQGYEYNARYSNPTGIYKNYNGSATYCHA